MDGHRDARWPPLAPVARTELATVAGWVRDAAAVTVLTGAGISTDSGIPDFRGPRGLWTRNPGAQRISDIQAYRSDPQLRRQAWRSRRDHPAWSARPNPAHLALVTLQRSGRLRALVTQNIDELHQRAGSDPALVLELHGTLFAASCLSCEDRTPMAEALDRVDRGEQDPHCLRCGGVLKIVNAEPTPYDDIAAALIREPIGSALPALVADL